MNRVIGAHNLLHEVFRMYDDANLGSCPCWAECSESANRVTTSLVGPISIWHVGPDFATDEHRVLFVGKSARGCPGKRTGSGLVDATAVGQCLLTESPWAYWGYTREIARLLYGTSECGIKRVAFTNLVKCTNSETTDMTTQTMVSNCTAKMKIISREIELLKPRTVIFYAGRGYDRHIDSLVPQSWGLTAQDRTKQDHRIQLGNKNVPWWERDYIDKSGDTVLRILRTGHPERICKSDFTKEVAGFIRNSMP